MKLFFLIGSTQLVENRDRNQINNYFLGWEVDIE